MEWLNLPHRDALRIKGITYGKVSSIHVVGVQQRNSFIFFPCWQRDSIAGPQTEK